MESILFFLWSACLFYSSTSTGKMMMLVGMLVDALTVYIWDFFQPISNIFSLAHCKHHELLVNLIVTSNSDSQSQVTGPARLLLHFTHSPVQETEYCISGWSLCTAPGVEALDIDPQIWVVGKRLMIPVFRCGNCKTRSPSVRITSRRARSSTSWLWVISTTTTPDTKRSPHSSSIPPHLTDKQFYFSGHDGCVRTLPAERGSETPDL